MITYYPVDIPPSSISERIAQQSDTEKPAYLGEKKLYSLKSDVSVLLKDSVIYLGGGRVLRMRNKQRLHYNLATNTMEVVGWGIKINRPDEAQKSMARKFLMLFQKAKRQQLTDSEKECWLHIIDNVDYVAYCMEEESPRYVEGKVINTSPFIIRWHDGEQENLHGRVTEQLSVLERGDSFCAHTKINGKNQTYHIERVYILDDRQLEQSDWPPKR